MIAAWSKGHVPESFNRSLLADVDILNLYQHLKNFLEVIAPTFGILRAVVSFVTQARVQIPESTCDQRTTQDFDCCVCYLDPRHRDGPPER